MAPHFTEGETMLESVEIGADTIRLVRPDEVVCAVLMSPMGVGSHAVWAAACLGACWATGAIHPLADDKTADVWSPTEYGRAMLKATLAAGYSYKDIKTAGSKAFDLVAGDMFKEEAKVEELVGNSDTAAPDGS